MILTSLFSFAFGSAMGALPILIGLPLLLAFHFIMWRIIFRSWYRTMAAWLLTPEVTTDWDRYKAKYLK